jgi:hypothetical protein
VRPHLDADDPLDAEGLMISRRALTVLLTGLAILTGPGDARAAQDFAAPLFAERWQRDEQLVPNFWGPLATATDALAEPYDGERGCPREVPNCAINDQGPGRRLVQYFDKGRMELRRDEVGGRILTSGLLVRELITGQVQVGDTHFETRALAAVPVAGDPTNPFPRYRDLGSGPAVATVAPLGTPVALLLTPQGGGTIAQQDEQTVVSLVDRPTGHGVPVAFAAFRARVGVDVVGLALTDPFWADVLIGGQPQRILIQAFERRVLTYNPANPAPFRVEFGNVGQQYARWRYGGETGT